MRLEEVYRQYRDKAHFVFVYIKEAHPADEARQNGRENSGGRSRSGRGQTGEWSTLNQPRTLAQRNQAATMCTQGMELSLPTVVDEMDDRVSRAYSGAPDRLFVVNTDGRIHYSGGRGPHGYDLDEMVASLRKLLGR